MSNNNRRFVEWICRYLLIFALINVLVVTCSPNLYKEIYAAKKKTTSAKTKGKKASKSKTSKKNYSKLSNKKNNNPEHIFLADTLLADGISYKRVLININNSKQDVHILQVNLNNPKVDIATFKAGNNITELARLPELLMSSNTNKDLNEQQVVAGINANFWRAYTNYPIGPTVVNGEVVEMPTHKRWTSTFINENCKPFMSNFYLQGEIVTKNYRQNFKSVNRRSDATGIVMYNRFGGDVIPYINSKKVEELLAKGLDNIFQEAAYDDSTEQAVSLEQYRLELIEAQRASNSEYSLQKVTLKYLDNPSVNTFVKCEVISIDTGSVAIPPGCCVISYGNDIDLNTLPKIGEKVNIHFWTNVYENEIFLNSVSGTPRLVRDGIAQHEAYEEGSKSKRFINGALARTAIGFDKDKSNFFMVVVDPRRENGTVGASLTQLAYIMEYIGCYSAQNLDGGGSTTMVINNKNTLGNVLNSNDPSASRRLSVALGAVSLKKEKEGVKAKPRKK